MANHKAFDANCTKSAQTIIESANQSQHGCTKRAYQNLN